MRLLSIALTTVLVAGLAWWFAGRHDPEVRAALGLAPVAALAPAQPGVGSGVGDAAPVPGSAAARGGPVRVAVIDSEAVDTKAQLRLRGRTEASRLVEVRAETEGLVATPPLRAGARVEAGQLLCRLAPGSRLAEMAEAEAALAEAEIMYAAADRLSAQGFAAQTTRAEREAKLEAARATVDKMRLELARLDILAPFGGQLEDDSAELGERLALGGHCATVVDLATLKVVAFVSERDVDRLAEGDAVAVRLVNGAVREGTIRFIASTADPETRTYLVEVVIDNADGALRDGMTAEISVSVAAGRAHKVPQSVLTLDDRGRMGVRLVEQGENGAVVRFAPVRMLRDGDDAAFIDGLPERARIIAIGQEFVRDGGRVVPVPMAEAFAPLAGTTPAEGGEEGGS
ncbi:MAG: efflux RND transporter periplasmic adaptor subunit [Pseudomonadota bacterium]